MVAEEIVTFLQAEGVGTEADDLWLDHQPEDPDDCVSVHLETAPALDEGDVFNIDTAGIQILIRAADRADAKAKAKTIHNKISGFHNDTFVVDGTWIRRTLTATPPTSIGQDDRQRHEWTIHYILEYQSLGNDNRTSI